MTEHRVRPSLLRRPGGVERPAVIGARQVDSDELRVRNAVLVLSCTLMATLAVVWVATYSMLGLALSAAIPFAYQLASAVSIYTFAQTRRDLLFRGSQLWMSLVLPFALQWSLGGFRNSSAVCLWAFTSPSGALLSVGARQAIPWFIAFAGLVGLSAAIDPVLAAGAPHIPGGVVIAFFALNVLGVATTVYVVLQYFVRAREREHARSERLLLNMLPQPVAARLKSEEGLIAERRQDVTVLFADIVGFTRLTERLSAQDLVTLLDRMFARWDALAARLGVEKIKTIGDAYMAASGVPLARDDHAEAIAELALEMKSEVTRVAADTGLQLQVRIGIDSGPVVAGVIGRAKFSYDVWGDTVNTASRMASHAQPDTIQITTRTCERLRQRYELRPGGDIDVKGKGPMTPCLLIGRQSDREALRGANDRSEMAPMTSIAPPRTATAQQAHVTG